MAASAELQRKFAGTYIFLAIFIARSQAEREYIQCEDGNWVYPAAIAADDLSQLNIT